MRKYISFLILLILLSINANAYDENMPHPVKANIIAFNKEMKPGEEYQIAVHFKIEPGWHIYWKNPGDSGLPTQVNYTLLDGYELKETYYPTPKSFVREGNILDYGYEDELLLISDMKTTPELSDNQMEIKGLARWVVCKEVCIPGSQELTLNYPVKDDSNILDASILNKWKSRVPEQISADKLPFTYEVNKQFEENGRLKSVTIVIENNGQIQDLNLFPDTDRSIYLKDISFEKHDKIYRYSFTPVIMNNNKKDIDNLRVVLSYAGANGKTKAIETLLDLSS